MRAWAALLVSALACASVDTGHAIPLRYRLTEAVDHWDQAGSDAVLDDLEPRYPAFFETLIAGGDIERRLRPLRDDLEAAPTTRANYDALNALAIAYFEMNQRAEQDRDGGGGLDYLALSFQSAKLLAVPWRAYSEVHDASLRGAILDFFEDAASGRKLGSARTAPRVASIVASLERKEDDAARIARIRAIAEMAMQHAAGPPD